MSQASQTPPLLLVVEDDRDTNHALCLMLQRKGYRVAAAFEPYEANGLVQDLLPDGIVLDLNMPAGGGRRFFDWMLANKATARIPVIVYSAQADRETQNELLGMGARAFVDKASPPDDLIATLVSVVGYVPPPQPEPAAPASPPRSAPSEPPPPPGGVPYPFTKPEAGPPPPPPGGVPYPYMKPDSAPTAPGPSARPRPSRSDQQRKLQEQLTVQYQMQHQPQTQNRPSQPPEHQIAARPGPPAQQPPSPPASADAGAPSAPGKGSEPVGKAVILIVDDSPDERFALSVRLRRKGYTVMQASNSHVALELARLHRPDVVLSDIHMPGISGLQLCYTLKHRRETEHIPVFLMSGLSQSISKKELARVGGSGFFEKPIDLNLLLVLLENTGGRKKTAAIQGFTAEALGRLDEIL